MLLFEEGKLSYVITEEGRLVNTGTTSSPVFVSEYYLKDHLGNTRVSFLGKTLPGNAIEITGKTDYYPFGLAMSQYSTNIGSDFSNNKYLYNGKEIQDDKLNGTFFGWLDYGARYYDAQIGRWHSVDPMVENGHHDYTPYAYCYNNPIYFIDPYGLDTVSPNTNNPIKQGDVVVNDDGTSYTYSCDDVTVTPQNNQEGSKNIQYSQNDKNIGCSSRTTDIFDDIKNNVATGGTPWMNTALEEYKAGVKEEPLKSNSGPKINVYLKYAGVSSPNAWCGAFVNWCLGQNGIKGAGAKGTNYLSWGVKVNKPVYGAIAIFKTGHVGFYMGTNSDGTLKIIHGNWSNRVKISSGVYDPIYPSQIEQYRMPPQR